MPKKDKGHTIKAIEIFAAGTWNGMSFKSSDLDGIVAAFKALGDLVKVPLKIGHNEEQAITDGQPAIGWVEDVWVEPRGSDGKPKLMAKCANVPKVVFDAITNKLFRKVSIELVFEASHAGRTFDNVLTAVALLGADMPAVNTLADLTAFMSRKSTGDDVVLGRVATFTAIGADQSTANGGQEMTELEKMQKRAEEAEANALKLKGENATFKAQQEADTKTADALKLTNHRAVLVGHFEKAVEAEEILPAWRDATLKTFGIDDDTRVMAVTEEQVKGLLETTKQSFTKGAAVNKDGDKADDIGDADPGDWLHQKTNEAVGENPKLTYSAAQRIVFSAHPKVAQAYQGFGGEE